MTVVVLLILIAMICAIGVVCVDIWKIKRELDYWRGITHPGMGIGEIIESYELKLSQKLLELTVLVVVTVILGVVSFVNVRRKRKIKASVSCLAVLLLFLLIPTVNAKVNTNLRRCYDRVEMYIPPGSELLKVSGYFTPQPAEVVNRWVCYHIGVGFRAEEAADNEWIAGGYDNTIGVGPVFYIEWQIDRHYETVTAPGISFGEQYFTQTYKLATGWATTIYDSVGTVMLHQFIDNLPIDSPVMEANAGGETIDPANYMHAELAELRWKTDSENGYWDGNKFSVSLNEDSPYLICVNIPYYDFTVLGGGEEEEHDWGNWHPPFPGGYGDIRFCSAEPWPC